MYKNWASDEKCTTFLSWNTHKTISETQEIVDLWIKKYSEENFCNWALELKSKNEIIGNIETVRFKPEENWVELAYCLGSQYWNNGYMMEAIKVIIDYLFEKYDSIIIRCDMDNFRSENIAQKLGFEFVCIEGRLKVYHLKK